MNKYIKMIEEEIILEKMITKIVKIIPIKKRRKKKKSHEEILNVIKELGGIAKDINMDADSIRKERILGSDKDCN